MCIINTNRGKFEQTEEEFVHTPRATITQFAFTWDRGLSWTVMEDPMRDHFHPYRCPDPFAAFTPDGTMILGCEAHFPIFGTIPEDESIRSSTIPGSTGCEAWTYTPPNYDKSTTKYPVLYLLHGNGEAFNGWVMNGRAHIILDNLIADKKAQPMIVVMPQGHALQAPNVGPLVRIAGETNMFSPRFPNDLLEDVVPLAERNYRVIANADVWGVWRNNLNEAAPYSSARARVNRKEPNQR